MPTLFTHIIEGELPAHGIWRDDVVAAFLTIAPINNGHTIVVPRVEVDHWINLDAETNAHLFDVGRRIGLAIAAKFPCEKVSALTLGFEVPHAHLHLIPLQSQEELDFGRAPAEPDHAQLAINAALIRDALRDAGETAIWE
jgi:histidine triad (HIT) family protein